MNKTPLFQKSLLGSRQSKIQSDYWDTVLELYEQGRYKDAVIGIIRYVDPSLIEKTGNAKQTEFEIPHGSVVIFLRIENDMLHITAPFLRIPASNAIPLLRQAAQISFTPLTLPKIILEGDKLIFTYSCPLSLCEPYKTYDVFREICLYADNYDDEFIERFGAIRLQEPKVQYYPKSQLDMVWSTVQKYLHEAMEYLTFYLDKRTFGFAWDIVAQTLLKIDYYVAPQGVMRTDMEKTISALHNEKISFNERMNYGVNYLKTLLNYNREKFDENIYISETFIPMKYSTNLENIQSNFQKSYDNAKHFINSKEYISSYYTLNYLFLNTFYHTNLPDKIGDILSNAMIDASSKPWADASSVLWQAIDSVMQNKLEKKSKGFFRRLFG